MLHNEYLDKKHLVISSEVSVCGNGSFSDQGTDLPENLDSYLPYDLGFLTVNIQNNRMV